MIVLLFSLHVLLIGLAEQVSALPQCLADNALNQEFEALSGGFELPRQDSCCMWDICGLACPEPVDPPSSGFGLVLTLALVAFVLVGLATPYFISATATNFFVAGRNLPLTIVAITLASQSLDSNALLGNVDLSYRFSFWDGVVVPVGLALSLVINGLFLARHIQADNALTLPDVFAKRYGCIVEFLVSAASITSFLMLFAGNLVGFGRIAGYLWNIPEESAIYIGCATAWMYTYAGGEYNDLLVRLDSVSTQMLNSLHVFASQVWSRWHTRMFYKGRWDGRGASSWRGGSLQLKTVRRLQVLDSQDTFTRTSWETEESATCTKEYLVSMTRTYVVTMRTCGVLAGLQIAIGSTELPIPLETRLSTKVKCSMRPA